MRSSSHVLVAIIVLLGGFTLVAGPAVAAGNGKFLSKECEQKVTALATASSKAQLVSCVDRNPNPTVDAAPCVLWTWYYNRSEACEVEEWVSTTFLLPSGEVIGQMDFQVKQTLTAFSTSRDWAHEVEFTNLGAWGVDVGNRLTASQACTGSCGSIAGTINDAAMPMLVPVRGAGAVRGSVFASGDVAFGYSAWRFWMLTPSGSDLPPIATQPVLTNWSPILRCDIMTPGTSRAGCVFPDFIPRLAVIQSRYPSYYKHIRDSQAYGLPNLLNRLVDPLAQQDNRNRACPGQYPRPPGFSCDEYPFATTYQGAFTGGYAEGRTLPGCQVSWLPIRTDASGWNSCMIPAGENTDGGNDLESFYLDNRVINGDRFYVLPQ